MYVYEHDLDIYISVEGSGPLENWTYFRCRIRQLLNKRNKNEQIENCLLSELKQE